MDQHQNQNYIVHPEKYATTVVKKPIIIDNTGQNKRHTLQNVNKNQQTQNIQNVPHGQNPHTILKNPNPHNLKNIPLTEDKRKTYTPSQIKQDQIIGNKIVEETYYIDPQSGKKITLNTKNAPKANNQTYNTNSHQHHNNNQMNTYQPQQQPQPQLKATMNQNYNLNPTASVFSDIFSSVDHSQLNQKKEQKIEEQKSPIIEIPNTNQQGPHMQNIIPQDPKKSASLMTVNSLANIPYNAYPTAEFSKEPFYNIAGYGLNSYNGKVKKYNEDRIKCIVNYQLNNNNIKVKPNISYFSIFDGHSGNKCSEFLKQNLHLYLFNSSFFPTEPLKAIRESFKRAEDTFYGMAYDSNKNILIDKSGSCALVMLIINDVLYSINLGDSRALYSYDTGKYLYQITRDHKPNDDIERARIENAGGKVFYANKVNRNGREIELKEEQFGKGFTFPYRILPGKIAVSLFYNILGSKNYWRLLC